MSPTALRKHLRPRGFSFVELILALGLLSVVILGIGALSLRIIRSTTESNDRTSASAVAATILDRVIRQGQTDPNFWDNDHTSTPYVQTSEKFGKIDYEYEVFAETVVDTSGVEIGNQLEKNRVKRVTLNLYWFDTRTQTKGGYAKLDLSVVRIVNEQGLLP